MKNLKETILEKLVINKNSKVKDPLSVLDVPIKDISHLKDILTKFFGDKVIKSGPVSKRVILFKGNYGAGQYVGDHFKIDLGNGFDNSKVMKHIYAGLFGVNNDQIAILQKYKSYKGLSAGIILGMYEKDRLKIGDNFKEWLLSMKDRYDKKTGYNDINLLSTFGLLDLDY